MMLKNQQFGSLKGILPLVPHCFQQEKHMKNEEEDCAVMEEQYLKTVPVHVHHMAQLYTESAAKLSQPLQGFFEINLLRLCSVQIP